MTWRRKVCRCLDLNVSMIKVDSGRTDAITMKTLSSTLKTLVTLTDASPLWSDEIARDGNPLLRSLMRYVQRAITLASETGHFSSSPDDHGQKVLAGTGVQQDTWTDVLLLTLSVLETVLENSVKGRDAFRALCKSWKRIILFHLLKLTETIQF